MDRIKETQQFLMKKRVEYIQSEDDRQRAEGRRISPVSDSDIAYYLRVPLTSWLAWLRGERPMSTDNVIKIARRWPEILGIYELDYLPVSTDARLNWIIDNWTSLDEETKDEISNIIQQNRGEPANSR